MPSTAPSAPIRAAARPASISIACYAIGCQAEDEAASEALLASISIRLRA